MSSQSVTMPCSIGYLIFNRPLYSWAFRPIKTSPSRAPAITRTCFGRPTLCRSGVGKDRMDKREKVKVSAPVQGIVRRRRGPNRENAQRREEAFWMILTSKAGFYRSRSLFLKRNDRQRVLQKTWVEGLGAYVVDYDWLVC